MNSGPLPPADLHSRSLPFEIAPARIELFRCYQLRYPATHYGFRDGARRFDAPSGEFGTMYLARRAHGAFAETLLRTPGATILERNALETRGFAAFTPSRDLRFVQLCGSGLSKIGATAEVTSARNYSLSQQWALALWSHPQSPDGIAYMSRHDDHELCFAVFDRAAPALSSPPVVWPMLGDLTLLSDILDHYDVGVVSP